MSLTVKGLAASGTKVLEHHHGGMRHLSRMDLHHGGSVARKRRSHECKYFRSQDVITGAGSATLIISS